MEGYLKSLLIQEIYSCFYIQAQFPLFLALFEEGMGNHVPDESIYPGRANGSPRILIPRFLVGLGWAPREKVVGEIRNLAHNTKNP